MRHSLSGRKLNRNTSHRMAMLRNLTTSLLKSEKIITTEAKAKEVKKLADKMISLAKEGSLSSRKRAISFIYEEEVVSKLFDNLGKRYSDRTGGFVRIAKMGPRLGDGAPQAMVELI